jgi:hypothetical protein
MAGMVWYIEGPIPTRVELGIIEDFLHVSKMWCRIAGVGCAGPTGTELLPATYTTCQKEQIRPSPLTRAPHPTSTQKPQKDVTIQ